MEEKGVLTMCLESVMRNAMFLSALSRKPLRLPESRSDGANQTSSDIEMAKGGRGKCVTFEDM